MFLVFGFGFGEFFFKIDFIFGKCWLFWRWEFRFRLDFWVRKEGCGGWLLRRVRFWGEWMGGF